MSNLFPAYEDLSCPKCGMLARPIISYWTNNEYCGDPNDHENKEHLHALCMCGYLEVRPCEDQK